MFISYSACDIIFWILYFIVFSNLWKNMWTPDINVSILTKDRDENYNCLAIFLEILWRTHQHALRLLIKFVMKIHLMLGVRGATECKCVIDLITCFQRVFGYKIWQIRRMFFARGCLFLKRSPLKHLKGRTYLLACIDRAENKSSEVCETLARQFDLLS